MKAVDSTRKSRWHCRQYFTLFPQKLHPQTITKPNSNHAVLGPPHCLMERNADLSSDYDGNLHLAIRGVLTAP